jgi:hypothetical protein
MGGISKKNGIIYIVNAIRVAVNPIFTGDALYWNKSFNEGAKRHADGCL